MKKSSLILSLILGLAAWSATAQPDGPAPDQGNNDGPPPGEAHHGRHRPPPSPLVQALDANHDGIIDASEIANASAELLTLDTNHDGQLTPDEYMPKRPDGSTNGPPPGAQGHHRHPPMPILKALDVNGDGIIDAKEIANAPAALLTLDKNGDGQLTPDEYRPHRPPPGEDGPGGPGPEGDGGPDGKGPPNGPPPDKQ